jgi:ribonucleoside-diphosphate reductase alpha chain
MNIIKRNGVVESLKLEKISARIKKQSYGLDSKFVDCDKIAIKVVNGLFENATTKQIDELIAEESASLATIHTDYSILASRILVSSLHKDTEKSFYKAMTKLNKEGLISEEFYKNVEKNKSELDSMIVYDRDFEYDYFGFKTLENSYLLKEFSKKIVERPQHLIMRVAVAIWKDDLEQIQKSYELMSNRYFTHATPTLFNAGTKLQQLSSCFLLKIDDDSLNEIYKILGDCAKISKLSGGIGISVSGVRAKGSKIYGTNGESDGIIPMLRVYNDTARYVNQSGKRKGSFSIYLETWHDDVFDFIDLRKNTGKEEMRARDLFLALWVSDLFMKAVNEDGDWYLMCPNESPNLHNVYGKEFEALYLSYVEKGQYRRKIKARDLWSKILENQFETGNPYILYKDHINEKSNQKNVGIISSSNLCVAPETQLLTDKGYITIGEHNGEEVNVWNGEEWSKTKVVKTGENQKLLDIKFSNGTELSCTEYHKFYVQKGRKHGTGVNKLILSVKRANELEVGDNLVKFKYPIIEGNGKFEDAYTQGFFTGDGCRSKNQNHIDLYGEKLNLSPYLVGNFVSNLNIKHNKRRFRIKNSYKKFNVPLNFDIDSRLRWLEGLCDSDGVVCRNGKTLSIQIASTHEDFLKDVQYMLTTLGISSKIRVMHEARIVSLPNHVNGNSLYNCKKSFRIMFGFDAIKSIMSLGFYPKRLKLSDDFPDRNCERFIKIESIEDNGRYDDTYCVNEPLKNKVIFNGILTGNCAEIVEYTSKDDEAVCNLASIALPKFIENGVFNFQKLYEVSYQATKNLDRVIDENYYPTKETKKSNNELRPVGLGVQGLADVFAMLKMPFDSDEAKDLNKRIFETIHFGSLSASKDMAIEIGKYERFDGSPLSKGIFQFDMWKSNNVANNKIIDSNDIELSGMWDWESLRSEIIEHGVRNSLLNAEMPTASTSQILGNNECFEPFTSNIYSRRTLSGNFIVTNKHLVKELISLGLWDENMKNKIILNDGSIQKILEIPQNVRDIYKTVWEIKMKDLIDMSADRGAFVCQTQSLNLFFDNVNYAKLSSSLMYGWLKGLKTGSYYIRTKPKGEANKNLGIDFSKVKETSYTSEEEMACSLDNPEACVACSA